jgi:hypothetical protein
MFRRFRDYLAAEFRVYKKEGIINVADVKGAADIIVTLMEGLEFHSHFLSERKSFEIFAAKAKRLALKALNH